MQLSELPRLGPREFSRRVFTSLRYRLAAREQRARQRRFMQAAPEAYRSEPSARLLPGVQLFSLVAESHFHLQVLSALSFLRHAGIPEKLTMVSDGSLTPETERRLRALHPVVEVRPWEDFITPQNRAATTLYAQVGPMGKKLAVVTGMWRGGFALYADTDVLFFAGAHRLPELLAQGPANYFVEDCGNSVISGLATPEEKKLMPVNAGFLIQGAPVPWDAPLAKLVCCLETEPERFAREKHYLEQTVVHLAYHAAGARRLPPAYVIDLSDAFEAEDRFCGPDIVMRHYLCQTREKFWGHARDYLR